MATSQSRRERRAGNPDVQLKKQLFYSADYPRAGIGGATPSPTGTTQGGGGGFGWGDKGARPASGDTTRVSPFVQPKQVGLDLFSQYFQNDYFREWDLSQWRLACEKVVRQGLATDYGTLTSWVFECSPFVQSLFQQLAVDIDQVPFLFEDEQGNKNEEWTAEITNKGWFKSICREIIWAKFWGFSCLNIDYTLGKVYKYPMANVDPINRMIRSSTYNFADGLRCEDHANLIFIQPSTSYEAFLGWMQPISRSFIQINNTKNNWVGAGMRLAYPIITAGYPQNDTTTDPNTGYVYNKSRTEAQNILSNINPTKGIAYPYTTGPDGTIMKSVDLEFIQGQSGKSSHMIFSDFNEKEKEEIMQMVLGGTLTSAVGSKGSLALGDIHMQKLDDVKKANLEYVKATINDELMGKLRMIYKNFPDNIQVNYDLSKRWTIDEIAKLAPVLQMNGKRLKAEAFESIGLPADYLEDAPEPVLPTFDKKDEGKKEVEMAVPGLFGLKKKVK